MNSTEKVTCTHGLYTKYAYLARVVANLEPAQVKRIFASSTNPLTFYPETGLYAYEFALGYAFNKAGRRASGRRLAIRHR